MNGFRAPRACVSCWVEPTRRVRKQARQQARQTPARVQQQQTAERVLPDGSLSFFLVRQHRPAAAVAAAAAVEAKMVVGGRLAFIAPL